MKPLKPVMAALLAASSLASPLARIAVADPTPSADADGVARAQALAHDKEFVARLISVVDGSKAARADIGDRLAKFIQSKQNGQQYLTDGLLGDKAVLPVAVGAAKGWPEATKADSGKVAALYYVIGLDSDQAPAWATADMKDKYKDEFKTNPVWSGRLADYLADANWNGKKQVAQSGTAEDTVALLNDAAKWALKILDDARTKGEIHGSIIANDVTGVNPPTTDAPRNPLDTTGTGSGSDDLYVNGAKVENVYGPHDNGFRTLSVKVYTMKDDNGYPINKIGIVDITKGDISSPSATQFIDGSKAGDTDVFFRPDGRHYTVTVAMDGTVTVRRAGTEGSVGTLSTSKADLTSRRDKQIRESGTVTIAGQPYYVLGQGGTKGSYLFFSKAAMDADPNGNAHPDLMGEVSQVLGDGSTGPIKGQPPLGTLPDGSKWHLEFNLATRMWEVKPGAGTGVDDGKPKTPPSTSTNTATNPPAGGTTDQPTTTTDPAAPTAAATSLQQMIDYATSDKATKSQVWVEDPTNKNFDADTLAKVRIMSNTQDGMKHFKMLFDPSLGVTGNAFEFNTASGNVRLLHVRGVKKYIALEYSTNAQYFDLPNFVNYLQASSGKSYVQAGSYSTQNGQMQNVTSVDIMEDVLTHPLKVKKDNPMIATVRGRVAKNAKDAPYVINGDTSTIYLGYGEVGMTVWPNEVVSGDKGNNDGLTGLRGPGTAVTITGGEPGDFKSSMDIGSGRTATLVKTENHAAIYVEDEDENVDGKATTVKTWSLMLEYTKNKLPSRSKALTVFGGTRRMPLPSGIHMQGLPGVDLPDSTQLMLLYGSTVENGAIAAYRNALPDSQGGSNVRDKKGNCAGPVLWWGKVTKDQAQAACEGDSKVH
jgi:hypothetical protein